MHPSNSCNADAIGTAEEKTVQVAQSFSKLTEVYRKIHVCSKRFSAGTVDSFHDTLAKVA
jgi:predicted HD phosphohydrolase